jgi:cbb3-type cytochrome oxidase maturation protein
MTIILLLIPLSVVIATAFLGAFIWAVRSGQYEDTCTPSMRMLLREPERASVSLEDAASPALSESHPEKDELHARANNPLNLSPHQSAPGLFSSASIKK